MKLENKVAVVTGGTRGIGKAICERLGKEGASIAVLGTSEGSTGKAVEELTAMGIKAKPYPVNVANTDEVAAVFKEIVKDFGKIDILVNNAGITKDTLIMRMKENDFDQVIDVNLKGAFNCLKAVTRPMMKAKGGRIVNISSVVGLTGNPGQANYSASKAGLLGLTKSAAKELASRNITVNAVAPGFIETDMTEHLPKEALDAFLNVTPLQRGGKPEEVAAAVEFLVSQDAAYITGQTLNVDGGMVM